MEAISGTMMMMYMAGVIAIGWVIGRMIGELSNPAWHVSQEAQVVTSIFTYCICLLVMIAVIVNLVPHKLQHIVIALVYIVASGLAMAAYWKDWNR